MKKFFKKLKYVFDNTMSKGTITILSMLTAIMLIIVLAIAGIIMLGGFSEEGVFYTVWEVLSTTINAWMPSAEDGDAGYVLMIALSAIVGLFFTSFVIGIISTAIEDKLSQLRKGNSDVIEKDHVIILGFDSGKYTLIQQMLLAVDSKKTCVVIAEDMDKEEMEDLIRENVEIPKKVKLVCRSIDTTDPVCVAKCSLDTARLIVVNPIEDSKTVKSILAVLNILGDNQNKVKIATTIMDQSFMLPEKMRKDNNIIMLKTDDILSRIIAHSCTQSGLANAFYEVFKFEGNEFYLEENISANCGNWGGLQLGTKGGVPIGIIRDGNTYINPAKDMELLPQDKLIVFEENKNAVSFENYEGAAEEVLGSEELVKQDQTILLVGMSNKLESVIAELPYEISEIAAVGGDGELFGNELIKFCGDRNIGIMRTYSEDILEDTDELEQALEGISHVILMADTELEAEEADMKNIMILLKLKDIRERLGYEFNITVEMHHENNRALLNDDGGTDYIVSTDMASMVLIQVANTPELYDTFAELLSNEGNEFYLRTPEFIDCQDKTISVRELRSKLLDNKCILLGYIGGVDSKEIVLNPDASAEVTLSADDKLIVIGENVEIETVRQACG